MSVSFHFQRWETMVYAKTQIAFSYYIFFSCILPQLFCSFRQLFYYSKSPFQNWAADPSRKCLIDYSISWWRIIISCIYPPKKLCKNHKPVFFKTNFVKKYINLHPLTHKFWQCVRCYIPSDGVGFWPEFCLINQLKKQFGLVDIFKHEFTRCF